MKNINVKNTGYAQMLSWNAMIAVRTAHKHMSTCCYPNILCFMTLPLSRLISAFGQTLQLENSLVWKTFWYSSIPLFPNVFSVYTNIESHLSGLHVDRLLYSYSIKCLRTLGRLTTNWELRYPLDAPWPSIIKKIGLTYQSAMEHRNTNWDKMRLLPLKRVKVRKNGSWVFDFFIIKQLNRKEIKGVS